MLIGSALVLMVFLYSLVSRRYVEAGLNDGLSVPFLMFFIAVARAGTEGGGRVLLRYVAEQLGMGALVGLIIGLVGGRVSVDLAIAPSSGR